MDIKKKRIRSPNFPFISLEKSLEFIKIIYSAYDKHPVPLEVVGKAIGVSAGSYLAQHVSAFTQYGLVGTEGEKDGRKIKVSDLAFKIIVDERPVSADRDDLIKQAALNPTMFRKIHGLYPNGLPAVSAGIEYDLRVDHGFNPKSIGDFINTFKSTMEFAKIYFSGEIGENNIDTEEPEMNNIGNTPMGNIDSGQHNQITKPVVEPPKDDFSIIKKELLESFPITLKGNKKAVLSFSSLPIKKADIELIKKYLDLMADNWSTEPVGNEKQN
jgi:hypothetical protein